MTGRFPRGTRSIAMVSCAFFALLGACFFTGVANAASPDDLRGKPQKAPRNVIYGEDNRLDYYQVSDRGVQDLANSTVALMRTTSLQPLSGGELLVEGTNYGASYNLCPEEPFREQDTAAFCSGFLVAPDIVVTAGHCMMKDENCPGNSFVFGYSYLTAQAPPTKVSANDVYTCKELIRSVSIKNGADYAIVRLDRPVVGRKPLEIRRSGSIQKGEDLTLIGHPAGLPTKVADGAKVRSTKPSGYFVATTDSYGGNSGSAVFNSKTRQVEGILVRGETDFFTTSHGCAISITCGENDCRGEDITRISEILPYLPSN
jgi:hypothetical protein